MGTCPGVRCKQVFQQVRIQLACIYSDLCTIIMYVKFVTMLWDQSELFYMHPTCTLSWIVHSLQLVRRRALWSCSLWGLQDDREWGHQLHSPGVRCSQTHAWKQHGPSGHQGICCSHKTFFIDLKRISFRHTCSRSIVYNYRITSHFSTCTSVWAFT